MAQLLVRNIEAEVVQKLREKAAKDGISMEEEHRRILREALLDQLGQQKLNFIDYLLTMPDPGDDHLFDRPHTEPRPVEP